MMDSETFRGEKAPLLKPLFDPRLLTLPCPLLESYPQEQSFDYGEFYCPFMREIGTPPKEAESHAEDKCPRHQPKTVNVAFNG